MLIQLHHMSIRTSIQIRTGTLSFEDLDANPITP